MVAPRVGAVSYTHLNMHPNEAYEILRHNEMRDKQIIADVKACVSAGRTPVVLSKYKDHSEKLYESVKDCADYVFLLTGNNSKREHRKIREQDVYKRQVCPVWKACSIRDC